MNLIAIIATSISAISALALIGEFLIWVIPHILFRNSLDRDLEMAMYLMEKAQKLGNFTEAEKRQQWRKLIAMVYQTATKEASTFKDEDGNLYAFHADGISKVTVVDTDGNISYIKKIEKDLLKKLKLVAPNDNIAFSYIRSKITSNGVVKSHIEKEDHLIMQLLKKKASGNLITYAALLLAFIGEYIEFKKSPGTSILLVMLLTALMLLCNFVNQRVLKYRVDHGLYGTCYSESKEIIAFALEWREEHKDSNTGMPKLVFNEKDIMQGVFQTNGEEEYAG